MNAKRIRTPCLPLLVFVRCLFTAVVAHWCYYEFSRQCKPIIIIIIIITETKSFLHFFFDKEWNRNSEDSKNEKEVQRNEETKIEWDWEHRIIFIIAAGGVRALEFNMMMSTCMVLLDFIGKFIFKCSMVITLWYGNKMKSLIFK